MSWKATLRRGARAALSALGTDPATAAARSGYFHPDDIGWICETYFTHGSAPGTPWDALRHAHMTLPSWFRHDIDPLSEAYAEQQHRLWQLISGVDRPYAPDVDEKEHDWGDIDPVRLPGYLARRDPLAVSSASDHVIATGMFLKHCGLKPGDWALEYGAGFGQTALALARLGVNVDTVDISTTFCEFVRRQAEFFQVPLNAFHDRFGVNPRPGQKYQMIWFYESFHHCLDFQNVVRQLGDYLAEGGRVILGGEPIVEREYAAVPYPWGMRLHSEVTAVVRKQHWFELGFSERFLVELFCAAGFVGRRIDCEPSLFGRLYVFELRPDEIDLGKQWLPTVLAEQWHGPKSDGRGIKFESRLPIDSGNSFRAIEIDLVNPHWRCQQVEIVYGDSLTLVELAAGQSKKVRINASGATRELIFRSKPRLSALLGKLRSRYRRGVLVRRLRYVAGE
jgi:SAM-dependent methyltransferase